ncbi:hypothetical protein K438DRAFT_1767606 [Mycena galopus ATCC 62051]|nr:hypothetical protein K438DRAFT_1767606 [Mycena galopus ATCC 62051]
MVCRATEMVANATMVPGINTQSVVEETCCRPAVSRAERQARARPVDSKRALGYGRAMDPLDLDCIEKTPCRDLQYQLAPDDNGGPSEEFRYEWQGLKPFITNISITSKSHQHAQTFDVWFSQLQGLRGLGQNLARGRIQCGKWYSQPPLPRVGPGSGSKTRAWVGLGLEPCAAFYGLA